VRRGESNKKWGVVGPGGLPLRKKHTTGKKNMINRTGKVGCREEQNTIEAFACIHVKEGSKGQQGGV
jgi:hypothetical protein